MGSSTGDVAQRRVMRRRHEAEQVGRNGGGQGQVGTECGPFGVEPGRPDEVHVIAECVGVEPRELEPRDPLAGHMHDRRPIRSFDQREDRVGKVAEAGGRIERIHEAVDGAPLAEFPRQELQECRVVVV